MILKFNGLDPLVKLVNDAPNPAVIKHGVWALSNLCRGKPLPKFEFVYKSIPTFAMIMQEVEDPEILSDAAWALCYLSDGKPPRIQIVVQTGVVPALVEHLE